MEADTENLLCALHMNAVNYNFFSFIDSHIHRLRTSAETGVLSSATKRKFEYRRLIDATDSEPVREDCATAQPSTILMETVMLTKLVENFSCTSCGTFAICVGDSTLGLVCALESHCTTYDKVISSIFTSDRLGSKTAGNIPFVVNCSAVSATMDKGVEHSSLVRLCRYHDMGCIHHKTYATHVKEVAQANMVVTTRVLGDAACIGSTTLLSTRTASLT